jgi:hypothetical protein
VMNELPSTINEPKRLKFQRQKSKNLLERNPI